MRHIFNLSINTCTFPAHWKLGEIIPIAKNSLPQVDNDLRPVTLTPILGKCLERIILDLLMPYICDKLDPLQFAYVNGRSTEDATCTLVHRVCQHLDAKTSNTARDLFLDYSSAFNCIQPHIMMNKLVALGVSASLCLLILDILTSRSQYVRTSHETSSLIMLNTGAPQGCVLSPVLFVLYTNDMKWTSPSVFLMKYADDTVIVGLIDDDNDNEYFNCIDYVNRWCSEAFLNINVSKTKELIWDFRKIAPVKKLAIIGDESVVVANEYKYLGLLIDDKISFATHVEKQSKKVLKRIYCIKTMCKLNVDPSIISLFIEATVITVLIYASSTFLNMLTSKLYESLDKPIRLCKRLLKNRYNFMLDCNLKINLDLKKVKLAHKIRSDPTHPLYDCFCLMPSQRRFRLPCIRTAKFRNSFIPRALILLNASFSLS